jgi:hypothetical protein
MTSSPNLDDITKLLDLIAAPWALEVLDGLGKGHQPSITAPAECDAATIEAAVNLLVAVGAIEELPGEDNAPHPVALTPAGDRLLRAFLAVDQTFNIKYP